MPRYDEHGLTQFERDVIAGYRAGDPPAETAWRLTSSDQSVRSTASKLRRLGFDVPTLNENRKCPPAVLTVERLAPRRGCLEGAQQTLEAVRSTLANAETLELARTCLEAQVDERLELLDLALRQFDAALAGEEPPTA